MSAHMTVGPRTHLEGDDRGETRTKAHRHAEHQNRDQAPHARPIPSTPFMLQGQ
jgi:hypothetical protein